MIGLALAMMTSVTGEEARYIKTHYPAAVQPLILRATALSSEFVNTPPTPLTLKARQRYVVVSRQLKARGWCWGSELEDAASSDMTWTRCNRVKSR